MGDREIDASRDEAFRIRRAEIRDAEGIHRAHMRSIREICSKVHRPDEIQGWGNRPYDEDLRVASIRNDFVWVVEIRGAIEGYGHLQIRERDGIKVGYVAALYLTPEAAGRSVGRSILDLMMNVLAAAQVREATLEASLIAQRFYQRAGFESNGPESTVMVGGSAVRFYPMRITLPRENGG